MFVNKIISLIKPKKQIINIVEYNEVAECKIESVFLDGKKEGAEQSMKLFTDLKEKFDETCVLYEQSIKTNLELIEKLEKLINKK